MVLIFTFHVQEQTLAGDLLGSISPAGVVITYMEPESSMDSSCFEKGRGTTTESTST